MCWRTHSKGERKIHLKSNSSCKIIRVGAISEQTRSCAFEREVRIMEIKKIGVIGAGQMGSGIAEVAIVSGFNVAMRDVNRKRSKEVSPASLTIWNDRSRSKR